MTTKAPSRDEALLRAMRLPELREMPDVLYEAVVNQANRIARSDFYIRRTQRSMERARVGLAEDTWPSVRQVVWDHNKHREKSVTWFDAEDTVTLCWLIDLGAGEVGFCHLHALYVLARRYHDRPWVWNHVHEACIVGSLRSYSHAGLVTRVAPAIWALTDLGNALLDTVFS